MITLNKGFKIFQNNYFDLDEMETLKKFDKDYKDKKFLKNDYENVAIVDKENLLLDPFYQKIYRKIIETVAFDKKIRLFNLWLVLSQKKNYSKNKLPFIPHIDKRRMFKVMIYLNDVFVENGPIHLHECDVEKYENKRLSLKKDYKINQENEIKDFKIENYQPCTGKFGSSIFFDSNCPHFAGKIYENNERKILRFNFEYF